MHRHSRLPPFPNGQPLPQPERLLSFDLHPKKVTHKKSTGAKKVTFLEEKNGKRKCTSRSKNQSNN